MKEFDFFLDEKVTTWMRTRFSIKAETREDAIEVAVRDLNKLYVETWEEVPDVKELMTVEENNGVSTKEIYLDGYQPQRVWENGTQ